VTWFVVHNVPARHNAFEVLGFDILVDQKMKPWLLEVNHAPNLEPHTILETEVKRSMLRDLMQLVDIEFKEFATLKAKVAEKWAYVLSLQQKETKEQDSEDSIDGFSLTSLSNVDVWVIVDTVMENNRRGGWERLFPNHDSTKYIPLLNTSNRNFVVIEYLRLQKDLEEVFAVKQPIGVNEKEKCSPSDDIVTKQ